MASRKPQSASPPQLTEEFVWLAACVFAELGITIAHDGTLPSEGAGHLSAEKADAIVVEFNRRYRKVAP